MNLESLIGEIKRPRTFANGEPAEEPLEHLRRVRSEADGAWFACVAFGQFEAERELMALRHDAFCMQMALMGGLAS